MSEITSYRALVVSDGTPGNENQARALAEALTSHIKVCRLNARMPWQWAAPHRLPGSQHAFGPDFPQHLEPPWPDVAIGCGRQAALALRLIGAASSGACRTVQILDPRIDPGHFDLVVAPQHDGLSGNNVIITRGGLNRIDDEWLARARKAFPHLAALTAPRYALLLGGPTRALKLDRAYWDTLVMMLSARLERDGGSLMLSSSQRTPEWIRTAARTAFGGMDVEQWHGTEDGPNPYGGFLGWADELVVTPDSVNMLSEAAATRARVWTTSTPPVRGKLARFINALHESGRIRFLGEAPAEPCAPLRENARVADEVRQRLGWS